MASRIRDTSRKAHRVRVSSRTARAVAPEVVGRGLGAEVAGHVPGALGFPALHALRAELGTALRSQGGRPSLQGKERRQKIPMASVDWVQLEAIASGMRADGLAVTPGQVAAQLLHDAIAAAQQGVQPKPYPHDSEPPIRTPRVLEATATYGGVGTMGAASGPEGVDAGTSEDAQLWADVRTALQVTIDARAALWKALASSRRNDVYHHMSEVLHRLDDISLILQRLAQGSGWLLPRGLGGMPPSAGRSLELDSECLLVFGAMLLDQWARVLALSTMSGHVSDSFAFHHLVVALDKDGAEMKAVLRESERRRARWLAFWLRTYRNKFLVHAHRPRQRSWIAGAAGSFQPFTMPLPAAEDQAQLAEEVSKLWQFAPDWLKATESTYWERQRPGRILERIVENIGVVDRQADRESIAAAAERFGMTAPPFQVLGSAIVQLVTEGTRSLVAKLQA